MNLSPKRLSALLRCLSLVVATCGCRVGQDFLPRTHTTSVSPNGRHTAFVRQALNIDPPDDHLYLSVSGGPVRHLMDLPADADWCKTIIWTADSRKVGFLIDDERLAVFDAETATLEALLVLVGSGVYGGMQEARAVSFNHDGTQVSFERFDRATMLMRTRDGEVLEAPVTTEGLGPDRPARPIHRPPMSHGREVVHVPVAHLRIRLVSAAGQPTAGAVWARLVSKDQRQVDVRGTPVGEGVFVLPAFDDGPLQRVELSLPGQWNKRKIVKDVKIAPEPVAVDLGTGGDGG